MHFNYADLNDFSTLYYKILLSPNFGLVPVKCIMNHLQHWCCDPAKLKWRLDKTLNLRCTLGYPILKYLVTRLKYCFEKFSLSSSGG